MPANIFTAGQKGPHCVVNTKAINTEIPILYNLIKSNFLIAKYFSTCFILAFGHFQILRDKNLSHCYGIQVLTEFTEFQRFAITSFLNWFSCLPFTIK